MLIEINNATITKIGVEAITDFYKTIAIDQKHVDGLDVYVTSADSISLNVVIDTRKEAFFSKELIEDISRFYQNHHVLWGWFITAMATPVDIENHGFQLSYQTPGMYFDLLKLQPMMKQNELAIKHEEDDLTNWIKPLQEGFPSEDNCEAYRKLNAKLQKQGEKKLRHYTAYYDNEPASSATLFFSDRSVMLHNLATRHKFRKLGIASALTLHMMREASQEGFQHCFLDASDEGLNLYKRLGFQVYCMTSVYVLS